MHGLNLSGIRRHGDIGNGRVLGFTRAMTDHSRVMVFLCQINGRQRFRKRANLIYLDQNGIRYGVRQFLFGEIARS